MTEGGRTIGCCGSRWWSEIAAPQLCSGLRIVRVSHLRMSVRILTALRWRGRWAVSRPVSLRRHRLHKPRVSSSVTTYLCSNISVIAQRSGLDVIDWEAHGKRAGAFRTASAAGMPTSHRSRPPLDHPTAAPVKGCRGVKLAADRAAGKPDTRLSSKIAGPKKILTLKCSGG
jgi:hypothetical protein